MCILIRFVVNLQQKLTDFPYCMKSNRIVLLLIFFAIGCMLYYKDKPGPISKIWHNITHLQKDSLARKINPFKAPEPKANVGKSTTAKKQKERSISTLSSTQQTDKSTVDFTLPDFVLPAIQKTDEIIYHKNYTLRYEEKYELPAWVAYKLRGEYTKGRADRSENQFVPDRKVKEGSALSTDYTGSGYDRGHMVPAGDFKCCQEMMNETFFMSNICPQMPDLNRGIWENIESRIRSWAMRDEELYIVTGPVFSKNMKTIGRYNTVSVPKQYYKIVLYYPKGKSQNARAIAFVLPNSDVLNKKMNTYVVSIDEVEKKTGLDFFTKLPDAIENQLEAASDWSAWTKTQK